MKISIIETKANQFFNELKKESFKGGFYVRSEIKGDTVKVSLLCENATDQARLEFKNLTKSDAILVSSELIDFILKVKFENGYKTFSDLIQIKEIPA